MGISWKKVSNKKELKSALHQFQDKNVILIDTPGLAPNDSEHFNELKNLMSYASPDEVHLLLNAYMKDIDMKSAHQRFRPLGVNRLLFSKLDETLSYGFLLNQVFKMKTSLSYFSSGPEIPEHLSTATAKGLLRLLLDEREESSLNVGETTTKIQGDNITRISLPNSECYVANKNSDIFHHKDCKSVSRINGNNIVVFQRIEEALDQNFKPCRTCCQPENSYSAPNELKKKAIVGRY